MAMINLLEDHDISCVYRHTDTSCGIVLRRWMEVENLHNPVVFMDGSLLGELEDLERFLKDNPSP